MKHLNSKKFLAIAFLLTASPAAMGAPPSADLAISIQAPASELVNTANLYTFRVSNLGNKDATLAKLEVTLPTTGTSPQVLLMGTLSQVDSRCLVSIGKLTCNLGTLRKGASQNLSFRYAIPVSSSSVAINGRVLMSAVDGNASNNLLQYIPNQTFYSHAIVGPVTASNSHCTGSPALSSYFECESSPSSISQHTAVFEADGTISFPDAPGYYGYWQQSPTQLDRVSFQYYENADEILNFQGFGSKSRCFEGVSHFPESPDYVSPYQVCF